MDVKSFRSRMIKLGLFMLIVIVGFPFILYGLVKLTSCGGGGACGALAAMGGMILRPLALVIFAIGVSKAVVQRCLHAQLSRGWVFMALLWMLGSSSFLLGSLNFWGANFGMGLLAISPPALLLFLAVFTIFLSFYNGEESSEEGRIDLQVAWVLSWFSTGLALFLHFPAVKDPFTKLFLLFNVFSLQDIVAFNRTVSPIISLAPPLHLVLSWVAPITFGLTLLYIYLQSRQRLMPEAHRLGFQ